MTSRSIATFRAQVAALLTAASLTDLREEVAAERDALTTPLEGMRDFMRVALPDREDGMEAAARDAATVYQRRLDGLDAVLVAHQALARDGVPALPAFLAALDALEADGYPEVPLREVPAAIYAQLVANQESITAALEKFAPITATTAALDLGGGTDKPGAVS